MTDDTDPDLADGPGLADRLRTRTRDNWWRRPWTGAWNWPGPGTPGTACPWRGMMDDGLPNTWTPHKALRRIADHLVDHLHQVEALLAGATPLPDEWLGRTVTLDADWSRFTEPDYAEACSRLRRLGRWYVLRYETAGADAWDQPRPDAWTLREIAEHVAGVTYYADQVGSLD